MSIGGDMTKLNYKKMIKDINDLVDTDFGAEMEMKELPKSKPFTQKEAKKMARIIAKVYIISHQIYCKAHGIVYLK